MHTVKYATVAAGVLASFAGLARGQQDLLPDIIVRQSDLYDNDVVVFGGKRLLRLSNGTPNIGDGKLYVYGVFPPNDDGTQTVRQRIYRTDGTFWDRDAGYFVYHSGHNHIHFENWAIYRLREVLANDGVGATVAEGDKTSFCILDLGIYDRTLPNFDPDGQFHSCNTTVQGLSVGWLDIYHKQLQGQSIDITGVPDGVYWLESEVDPGNGVLEKNESNNISRVKVSIGGEGLPDYCEPNESLSQVLARREGGANSPNLGPVGPETTLGDLTIHDDDDLDLFRFSMNHTGGAGDFVRVEFDSSSGDLDLELWDANGQGVAFSHSGGDSEVLPLAGVPEGWYYAVVYGFLGATVPRYTLTLNPSENTPPEVQVLTPPAGNTVLEHGTDTYRVEWTPSDAEGDQTWVTVYLNHHPELDEHAILLPDSLHTPGAEGFYTVNSADVPVGTYYAICQITDGGSITESSSPGTVSFVEICPGDFNRDGARNTIDVVAFLNAWASGNPSADFNQDGSVNTIDVTAFLNAWNGPC